MRNDPQEQRHQSSDALRRVGITLLALLVAIALIVILCGSEPDPEPNGIAQEYAARLAAAEDYERVINLGYSEWSALEAAEIVFEEVINP